MRRATRKQARLHFAIAMSRDAGAYVADNLGPTDVDAALEEPFKSLGPTDIYTAAKRLYGDAKLAAGAEPGESEDE